MPQAGPERRTAHSRSRAATSKVSAQLRDGRAGIPGFEAGEALGDPSDGSLIAEHLQRDLEPFKVIDRYQYELRLAVACDGNPLMLLADPPTKLRQASLDIAERQGGSRQESRVAQKRPEFRPILRDPVEEPGDVGDAVAEGEYQPPGALQR